VISISTLYCGGAEDLRALRYGPAGGRHRKEGLAFSPDRRPIVVWNCTRRCNLRCMHCYSQSADRQADYEMSGEEAIPFMEDLARFGVPVLLFSGGEPLLREDLYELADRARRLGLRTVVSTNGTLIDEQAAERLAGIGLSYVGVSLDGMRGTNDRFRGMEGAFDRAMAGVRNCMAVGLKVGLRFTISRYNVHDVQDVCRLAVDEGVARVCFYHLVYAGRGAELMDDDLDHEATRRVVDRIIDWTAQVYREGMRKEVLTVDNHADGPYLYLRMVREGNPAAEDVLRLLRANGGNASGSGIGCVSWDGEVYADQFWRHLSLGNVRTRRFSEIWTDLSNPLMARLKDKRPYLRGRCRRCRFLDMCGGNFRVRAEAATGDVWACDPACYLTDEEVGATSEEGEGVASHTPGG
jgi:radical SAM protein with 4Fe4S-binding SPASM domain